MFGNLALIWVSGQPWKCAKADCQKKERTAGLVLAKGQKNLQEKEGGKRWTGKNMKGDIQHQREKVGGDGKFFLAGKGNGPSKTYTTRQCLVINRFFNLATHHPDFVRMKAISIFIARSLQSLFPFRSVDFIAIMLESLFRRLKTFQTSRLPLNN